MLFCSFSSTVIRASLLFTSQFVSEYYAVSRSLSVLVHQFFLSLCLWFGVKGASFAVSIAVHYAGSGINYHIVSMGRVGPARPWAKPLLINLFALFRAVGNKIYDLRRFLQMPHLLQRMQNLCWQNVSIEFSTLFSIAVVDFFLSGYIRLV